MNKYYIKIATGNFVVFKINIKTYLCFRSLIYIAVFVHNDKNDKEIYRY